MPDAPTPSPDLPAADGPPGIPRWVKVSGAIILLLVAVLAVSKVAGVEHGPGRHSGSDNGRDHAPPAGAAPNHAPPAAGEVHTGPPPGVTHGSE